MYAAGIQESETIYCDVRYSFFLFLFSVSPQFHHVQGKIKRTKPFYVDEFNYLKSLVAPKVSVSRSILQRY